MKATHTSERMFGRICRAGLAALMLLFVAHTQLLARGDSCVYDNQAAGCSEKTSTPKNPNYADSMFVSADLHDYSHYCQTEYCHGGPTYRGVGAPTDTMACTNRCENCCLYRINIENLRWFAKIDSISLCTDRGCLAAPTPPMALCNALTGGWDHICEYCPLQTRLYNGFGGWVPAIWPANMNCPRVVPSGIGPDTGPLADGYADSLCRSNCLRVHALGPGDKPGFLDTIQFKIGFTGDCQGRTRGTQGGGSYRGKCVWICIRWDDGVEACCQLRLPHCTCTGDPACYPPCNQDTCSGSVGPNTGPIPPAPPPGGDELSQSKTKKKGAPPMVKARKPETEIPGGTRMKER